MKRILLFIDSLSSGGAQRQLVGLAVLLKERGYDVKVLTYYDIPFYKEELEKKGVEHENVMVGRGGLPRLLKIEKAIKIYAPDTVIAYLDTPCLLACLLKKMGAKWKLIVSERNTTQIVTQRDKLKFWLYRYADIIVPNSYSQNDFIKGHYPKLAERCQTITNFVDTDLFFPSKNYAPNELLRIVGVGRIAKQKNIPVLIEALKLITAKGYKIRMDWYGKPFDSFQECVSLINKYGLKCFVFHDPFNPIADKYREADLFVLPSIYEGFPNVLCEAISCGLPSIASNVCDNERIVKHGRNGFLFPSNDSEILAKYIIDFINLPISQRIDMRRYCRSFALGAFSFETFVDKYISLIENKN